MQFDKGQTPTIAVINKATIPLGVDFDALIVVMQKYVDLHFAPIWGTHCKLVKSDKFIPGTWAFVFMNDADVQGALGYHDLTPDGFPLSKIFVRTTIQDGAKVSVTATHELAEMLVDPAINMCVTGPNGWFYSYETADAVEETDFLIDGVSVSNFVYPSYFEGFRKPGSDKFDHLGLVKRPFQILKGGYMPVCKNGRWSQIFGSKAKAKRFAKEDRRGHRSEYRHEAPKRKSKNK